MITGIIKLSFLSPAYFCPPPSDLCVCAWVFVLSMFGWWGFPGKLSQKHDIYRLSYNLIRVRLVCFAMCKFAVCLSEVVMCNCSVTLPSSLLFSNPSCMGQRMERASIWAPSPAYLLDTQVGTVHSSPLRLLRPLSPPPTFFFCTVLVGITVCSMFDMAWLSPWKTFSHTGASHAIPLCCTVLCVALGLWAYHIILYVVTLYSGAVSGLCVCVVYCWLFILFSFCGVGVI